MMADRLPVIGLALLVIPAAAQPGFVEPTPIPSTECYKHISNFDGICPFSCPLLASCEAGGTGICVENSTCPIVVDGGEPMNIGGALRCSECAVFGCHICEDKSHCKPDGCGKHFTYHADTGSCTWGQRTTWYTITIVLAVLSIWIVCDLVRAHLSETTNVEALDAGIQARWRSKLRKTWEAGSPQFSFLCENLHWHEPGVAPTGGPGFPIFMNCITLVGVLGGWLTAVALVYAPDGNPAALTPCSLEADIVDAIIFDEVNSSIFANQVSRVQEEVAFFPNWAFYNYVGAVVISVVYAVVQARLWGRLEMSSISQHRYCVEATGFPPEAFDKGELLTFFSGKLKECMLPADGVEYISIAYDYDSETKQKVDASLREHLKRTKIRLGQQEGFENPASHLLSSRGYQSDAGYSSSDEDGASSSNSAGPFWVRVLAYFMAGIDFSAGETDNPSSVDCISSDELDMLSNAGHVYVVLKSEALAVGFASIGRIFYDSDGEQHLISLKVTEDEPACIAWNRFDTSAHDSRWKRCILVALMLIFALIIWFLLYLPFAYILVSTSGYEWDFKAVLEGILGLLVSIGNCFIAAVVEKFVEYIGFTSGANRDLMKLVMIVPCNLVNCIADFFLVTYIVWRATEKNHSTFADFTSEWFALLFPSYVVVPYIAEPFMALLVPYVVAVLRIKRDKKITPEMAEEALLAPDNDIINPAYNDIIGTSSIVCFSFLFAPSFGHKILFPLLIVQCFVIYLQSRFKVLRWMSHTLFFSKSLHDCESMFWALPLGFLAAAYERQYFETEGHISSLSTPHSGLGCFCLHVLCHFVFLRFILPQISGESVSRNLSYSDLINGSHVTGHGQLANYLNTNPVEVLKSHVEGEDGKAKRELSTGEYLVYYRKDMRHLQPASHRTYDVKGWGASIMPNLIPNVRGMVKNARSELIGALHSSRNLLRNMDTAPSTRNTSSEDSRVLLAPDGFPFTMDKKSNGSVHHTQPPSTSAAAAQIPNQAAYLPQHVNLGRGDVP